MDEHIYYQLWWLPDSPYGRFRPYNDILYRDSSTPLSLIDKQPQSLFPNICVCKITVNQL